MSTDKQNNSKSKLWHFGFYTLLFAVGVSPFALFMGAVGFSDGWRNALFIAEFYGVIGAIIGFCMLIDSFVRRSLRGGSVKCKNVLNEVHLACGLFLSLIGIYFVTSGLSRLNRESKILCYVTVAVFVFYIYYWLEKKKS